MQGADDSASEVCWDYDPVLIEYNVLEYCQVSSNVPVTVDLIWELMFGQWESSLDMAS